MNRYDDYGLNRNETYIYRMTKILLELVKDITVEQIDIAMNESIELGKGRRIDSDYNYDLVKSRLCNWYDVKIA